MAAEMGRKPHARTSTRILIGHWHDQRNSCPHPQALVDAAWEVTRRSQIVTYLKSASVGNVYLGWSYCRCGCTVARRDRDYTSGKKVTLYEAMPNGASELCDDAWCWPEGLAHYVEVHGIRLPDEFVAHAAARNFEPGNVEVQLASYQHVFQFWTDWCQRNAAFQYEPNCRACTRAPPKRRKRQPLPPPKHRRLAP